MVWTGGGGFGGTLRNEANVSSSEDSLFFLVLYDLLKFEYSCVISFGAGRELNLNTFRRGHGEVGCRERVG